jgi:hypothetical protein
VEQRRHSVRSADPVALGDCNHGFAAFGDGLIRHECLALIMPRRLRRWGRFGRRSRLGRLRLRRWPRCGVVLRRRRDDDQRRRKILGSRRKRRGKGDERKRSGTSNGACPHGRVPRRRSICSRRGATYGRASPRRKSHLQPPQRIRLFASPVAHLSAAFELTPQPGEFCASPSRTVEPLSYHILRKKRNSPNAPRKMKTGERPRSSEMLIRHLDAISRIAPTRAAINKPNDGEAQGDYFPLVLASASLQPSLRLAACDLMHCARLPLPGLTSAQSFFSSALQALPTAAARMIAT